MALLEVKNLSITFQTKYGPVEAVRDLTFTLDHGESLGVVGESGCGKSITNLAIMGLLPKNAELKADKLTFNGVDLLSLKERDYQKLRGQQVAMIFQDPMSALNPCFSVGEQIIETISVHRQISKKDAHAEALALLNQVGIPAPEERLKCYPHELSGGMAQRVMIAMAISCRPQLLIADEPTTALDVTIQDQILNLLRDIQKQNKMALMLITHDLGVVAQNSDKIQVMYAGEVVESGPTASVVHTPAHPYTKGLLAGHPSHQKAAANDNATKENNKTGATKKRKRLPSIPGMVPDLKQRPVGCQFHPRCHKAGPECMKGMSLLGITNPSHANRQVRCAKPELV